MQCEPDPNLSVCGLFGIEDGIRFAKLREKQLQNPTPILNPEQSSESSSTALSYGWPKVAYRVTTGRQKEPESFPRPTRRRRWRVKWMVVVGYKQQQLSSRRRKHHPLWFMTASLLQHRVGR